MIDIPKKSPSKVHFFFLIFHFSFEPQMQGLVQEDANYNLSHPISEVESSIKKRYLKKA